MGVNKTTAAYYYHRLREIIHQAIADATPFAGEIEVDESYFGGRSQKIERKNPGSDSDGLARGISGLEVLIR